jgi:hypothetical protein
MTFVVFDLHTRYITACAIAGPSWPKSANFAIIIDAVAGTSVLSTTPGPYVASKPTGPEPYVEDASVSSKVRHHDGAAAVASQLVRTWGMDARDVRELLRACKMDLGARARRLPHSG